MADQVREADMRAAVQFYVDNPSAALVDFDMRLKRAAGARAATASHAADVEAMRADAERYRWLAATAGIHSLIANYTDYFMVYRRSTTPPTKESLDAAIDIARAALKGDKP